MPEVKIIRPIVEQAKKLRVAAYARVSSDSVDQLNSFATPFRLDILLSYQRLPQPVLDSYHDNR